MNHHTFPSNVLGRLAGLRQAPPRREALTVRLFRELALQDWIALVYLTTLLAACLAGDGPRRKTAIVYLLADIAILTTALVVSRGKILSGVAGAVVYRIGLFAAVFGSFSHLQYILPTARAVRVDTQLYAFDKAVFGFEPAEVFDRFVTTSSVEWFSFFYFGYFFILAIHIFPFMFAVKNMRMLSELSIGIITLFCVGHLLYIVVPGYGPYQHLAGHFTHTLDGPTWWRIMKATVDAGEVSSRTDIFPSLHTAAPTFLALFSFRHRRVGPFRYTWVPVALFASQIVISTMFLRWHYLIDVIAGLALAATLSFLSARVANWEVTRREALGANPVWTAPWSWQLTMDDGAMPTSMATAMATATTPTSTSTSTTIAMPHELVIKEVGVPDAPAPARSSRTSSRRSIYARTRYGRRLSSASPQMRQDDGVGVGVNDQPPRVDRPPRHRRQDHPLAEVIAHPARSALRR